MRPESNLLLSWRSPMAAVLVFFCTCLPGEGRGDDRVPASLMGNLMKSNFDTSAPAIAPPWSMRPWFWEDDINTSAAVWDWVHGCESHDLPIGAILIDSPWATAYNNFRFDEKRYPDPKGMIDQLHRRGIRVVLWMTNFVNTAKDRSDAPGDREDLYVYGKTHGYFVNQGMALRWWKGRGAMIDYSNPAAVAWWHRLMDRALSLGVDGWKIDGGGEMFVMTPRKTFRGTMSLRDYVDLYYRDTFDYSRRCKPDFVTMVRSVDIANSQGFDLSHAPLDAAPLTWTGDQRHSWDNKGIDEAIRSVFRAMDRGYPVASSDTGGYQTDPKHPDTMPRLLYLRWMQWNAWTPFFVIGGHDEHRPWKFDPEFLATFRRYLWLHQELIPFFYSQDVQASLREGKLMHRAPVGKNQYQLGDAFLVGVMDNDKPSRQMTFPQGAWLDYWDNRQQYAGGQTVTVAVPETRSPVFVRLGAIVAMDVRNDAAGHGSKASAGWRTIDCYPGKAESKATLWDTDHFPPQTARDRTRVTMLAGNKRLVIRVSGGPKRDTILRIRQPQKVASIQQDGKPIRQIAKKSDWEKSANGWWYDGQDQRLWIRLAGVRDTVVMVTVAGGAE